MNRMNGFMTPGDRNAPDMIKLTIKEMGQSQKMKHKKTTLYFVCIYLYLLIFMHNNRSIVDR